MSNFVELTWRGEGGLALYARDYAGSGGPARCPVVCIHGLTRNSGDFEEVAPWIAAQGRRVIAVDIRGRGRSARDPDPRRYNPVVYTKDVLRLLDEAGIARAVFIGTSMGGIITMAIAGKRLRAIAAAVLNDVGPVISMAGLTRIAGYVGQGRSRANVGRRRGLHEVDQRGRVSRQHDGATGTPGRGARSAATRAAT